MQVQSDVKKNEISFCFFFTILFFFHLFPAEIFFSGFEGSEQILVITIVFSCEFWLKKLVLASRWSDQIGFSGAVNNFKQIVNNC